MGVLKDLVQQNADSVNKMSVAVDAMQQQMRAQHDSTNAKLDQFSGQMQTLSDSLDEVKARLNNLEKAMKSVQDQQQSIDAALQNLTQPAAEPGATGTATPSPDTSPLPPPPSEQAPNTGNMGASSAATPPSYAPAAPRSAAVTPSKLAAPAPTALYKTALSDYMAAHYALASTEFAEIIRSSPADPLAGNSFYYLGEIDYRAGKYATAIKDYDRVLTQFPNNAKVPVSHLHKGPGPLRDRQARGRHHRTARPHLALPQLPRSRPGPQQAQRNGRPPRPPPPRPVARRIVFVCHSPLFVTPVGNLLLVCHSGPDPERSRRGRGRIPAFRRCLFLHFSGSILREMRLSYRSCAASPLNARCRRDRPPA